MRKYTPKNDVQKKSYYNDRFFVTPQTPKEEISSDEVFASDYEKILEKFMVLNSYLELGHMIIYVHASDNYEIVKFLKEELQYNFLMETSAIDFISTRGGFEVFYEMLSTYKHRRVRVKCFVDEKESLQSVNSLFRAADFAEREMFDMYGVKFLNHPNLKRILMPDDWHDHPLRKTYPLHGDEVAQWYEVDKIFGKEARDIIGPEERDGAAIDRYDTKRFARLGHEVPYGTDITNGKEPAHTPLAYQEEEGVGLFGKRLVEKFDENESKILDKRK